MVSPYHPFARREQCIQIQRNLGIRLHHRPFRAFHFSADVASGPRHGDAGSFQINTRGRQGGGGGGHIMSKSGLNSTSPRRTPSTCPVHMQEQFQSEDYAHPQGSFLSIERSASLRLHIVRLQIPEICLNQNNLLYRPFPRAHERQRRSLTLVNNPK